MPGSHSALAGFKFGESGCGCINKSKLVSFNLASLKNIHQITKLNTSSKFPTITVYGIYVKDYGSVTSKDIHTCI